MENRDKQHMAKLRDYYARHHVLPSFGGIAKLLGFKSTSAVAALMERLKPAGYFASTPDRKLQPGPRFFEYPLVDSVPAGDPQTANDLPADPFQISQRLVKLPSQTVILKVRGESMIEAGLQSGDFVVVRKAAEAKIGDIVVAVVDREYTIKYLDRDERGYFLRPGNKEFKVIVPKQSFEIFGVVTGSFREYA